MPISCNKYVIDACCCGNQECIRLGKAFIKLFLELISAKYSCSFGFGGSRRQSVISISISQLGWCSYFEPGVHRLPACTLKIYSK